jgi:hypothetical protein
MWNAIKWFFSSLFGSPSLQLLASIGMQKAMQANPQYAPIVRIASQAVIDKIDGKQIVTISEIEDLLLTEFGKSNLSKDQREIGTAVISTYKPMLVSFLGKIVGNMQNAKIDKAFAAMKELRALAVQANNAAGGSAV